MSLGNEDKILLKKNKMKIILFLFFALTYSIQVTSQVTLDHVYNIYKKDFYVSDIGNNDYKFIISDSTGFSLYNLDYSPYLLNVISPIPLWQAPTGYMVSYISKNLFDCDSSNIEFAITQWNNPANFYIFRTDGTLLFEKDSVTGYFSNGFADGSQYLKPIENTPGGTKLFLSDNRRNVIADSLYVYSLCGILPIYMSEIPIDNNNVQLFPNPSEGLINFQINLKNNEKQLKLTIYTSNFKKIDESIIIGNNYQLNLKEKFLSSGTYLFVISTDEKIFQTGKFIITK